MEIRTKVHYPDALFHARFGVAIGIILERYIPKQLPGLWAQNFNKDTMLDLFVDTLGNKAGWWIVELLSEGSPNGVDPRI
jgi:hypothetical protein